ncbi:MAG: tRNA (adenosine(37)-N6)-threonylcarbamoyltransferase complex ATPase subunit type 1 TsaE [Renibacterium sp.]|nr:tRNA (adenosine(37)-N6)-threonylcarbamoyltransferase complex ATPase subunit type 1 TsaE [Renibacterium sp.]
MKFDVPDLAGTRRLAGALAGLLRAGDLIILSGELGAGKTTFTQALGEQLGVRAGIISPTFVLVRIHPSLVGGPDLVHVDAYRLASAAEIDDIDLENTMDVSVTVVEWGDGRVEHLSDSYLRIRLNRGAADEAGAAGDADDEPRSIDLMAVGPRWEGTDFSSLLGS